MFWNHLRNLAIIAVFSGGLVFPTGASFAEDVGDQYYPTASDGISSIENIEKAHQKKMQMIDDEYKKKMDALEKRYNEKNAGADEHTKKMLALREKSATLKEERMKKREELEMAFIKRSQELHDADFEQKNQYVMDVKARKEYFENKEREESGANSGQ